MIAGRATRTAQRIDRVGAGGEPRRRRAEDDAGDEGEAEGKGQHYRRRIRVDRQERRPGEREREQQPRGPDRDREPGNPAADREHHALDQRLRHQLPARRAHREPHGGLPAPRHRAGEQQVGDVGAGDEQHEAADAEQNLQAPAVLLFHHADAGAGRDDGDDLLGQTLDDVGHPVRRIA